MTEPMIVVGRLRGAAESLRNCEEPFGCILRDRIAKLFDEGAEELAQAREALAIVRARQPATLARLEAQGVVFDKAPSGDDSPEGRWQNIAFWIYTDLCEVETIARAALAAGNGDE
jgi:hypothetical protein